MRKNALLILCFLIVQSAFAQGTGYPPYGTFQNGKFDNMNLANLNAVFSIPIMGMPGRGLGTGFAIGYNTWIWRGGPNWTPTSGFGWSYSSSVPALTFTQDTVFCEISEETAIRYSNFGVNLPDGTFHFFGSIEVYDIATDCGFDPVLSTSGLAGDGSGWYLDVVNMYPVAHSPSGHKVTPVWGILKDSNGNYTNHLTDGQIIDTANRTVLAIVSSTNYVEYRVKDVNGGTQTFTLNLGTYNIKTNFACPSGIEYTLSNWKLPSSLVLPNGQQYTFTYEATPGWSGWITARLKRVTLPTGGYYEYTYPSTPGGGMSCTGLGMASMSRTASDAQTSRTWDYSRVRTEYIVWPNYNYGRQTWKTTVTHPLVSYDTETNQSIYLVTTYGINDPHAYGTSSETIEKQYSGLESSNQLLQTIKKVRSWYNQPVVTYVTVGTQQKKIEADYESYGISNRLLETREYDWGTGSPGSLLRKTTNTYLNTTPYLTAGIRDRVTQTIVRDGAGNIVSRTDIAYDGSTPACVTGATRHDDTNYGCSYITRGNPTSITTWTDAATPSGPITTTYTYDTLGNVLSVTDGGSHTTNLSYADNYSDGVNRSTYAYVTEVTKPSPFNSQKIQTKYYYHIGVVHSVTDENSRVTSFSYLDGSGSPDKFNRLRKTTFPDGGETTIDYNDSARTVTATQKRTSTESLTFTELYNQLAQLTQRQLPGGRKVDITYDALGRQWKVSNPYVTPGEATSGVVETQFDALGRPSKTIPQEGSAFAQVEYAGNSVRATDESGKQTISQADGIGRVTRVCEVTGGNTRSPSESCGMTGFGGGTGYLTTLQYSVASGIPQAQITQGAQTRIQKYNGLGQMTSARVIEIHTSTEVTYAYDNDGNQTSITDPRGTVNFEYDELHRLKKKKHGTTVVAEFAYDGTQANNAIGRLITEWDGPAGSSDKTDYTYDTVGQVLTANRTVSSTVYAMTYVYDLKGNLTSMTYPSSSGIRRKVDYAYAASGELNKVSNTTDIFSTFDYVTGAIYSPLGTLQQLDFYNSVRTALTWNKRAQQTSLIAQKVGGSEYLNLGYDYYANGQIWKAKNNQDENDLKSEKYTYDELRRLLTAQRGPDTDVKRKYTYDYDRHGNRWAQAVTGGTGNASSLSFVTASNRIDVTLPPLGFSYKNASEVDQAGNLTANGPGSSYTYNQENLLTLGTSTLGSGTYAYDAQGRRVRKTVGSTVTDYFYSGSEVIAEKTGVNWTDYIFFGGMRIAKQTGTSALTATYLHTDRLGSTRRCSDSAGNQNGTCDYEPFGETPQPGVGGGSCSLPTRFRFAGMEFDDETGLYHTWFRQYDPSQGRWMSVDPVAGDTEDPQSLERYIYVRNDPVNLVDPLGLDYMVCSLGGLCGQLSDSGFGQFKASSPDLMFGGDEFWGVIYFIYRSMHGDQLIPAGVYYYFRSSGDTRRIDWPERPPPRGDRGWWGTFFEELAQPWKISTGPGSCLGVVQEALEPVRDVLLDVRDAVEEFAVPVTAGLSSLTTGGAVSLRQGLGPMMRSPIGRPVANPEMATALIVGANAVAAGTTAVAARAGAATARALPYAIVGTAIAAGTYAVGKEAYATATGKCRP